jgi:FLVCR family MFS transporter 7
MKADGSWVKMSGIAPVQTNESVAKGTTQIEDVYEDAQGSSSHGRDGEEGIPVGGSGRRPKPKKTYSHTHFKVYKRRWLGLGQLVLLNIIVSWDVS